MGLFDDLIPQQNGRAAKGDRLDRKSTLFDDLPFEVEAPDGSVIEFPGHMSREQIASVMRDNYGGPNLTLEQQRAVALARARRRREGEAQRPRKPNLFDDLIPQSRRSTLYDDIVPQQQLPPGFVLENRTAQQSLPPGFVLEQPGRRPNLFDDLPMEGEQGGQRPQQEQPEPGVLQQAGETASDFANQFRSQGMMLGFGDELFGALNTPIAMGVRAFTGEDEGKGLSERISAAYLSGRDSVRERDELARQRSPIASTVGEIGGALVTAPVGGSLNLVRGAGLLPRIANQATTGAIYGGGYGAGTSEGGLADRGSGALWGAGLGAGLGVAVPGVLGGLRSGAGAIRNAFGSPERVAARRLAQALETSGKTVDDVQSDIARARAGGAEGYAAVDSLGKPGQKLLRAANTVSEEAADRNAAVLGERMAGQGDRIMRQLQGRLGEADDFFNVVDDLAARTRRDAGPLYDQAYRELPTLSTRLKDVLSRPTMKQAIKRGMAMASDEGEKLPLVIDDLGNVQSHPDIRSLDYAKRALDDMIEGSMEKPAIGQPRPTAKTRSLQILKNDLLGEIAPEGSAYRQALDTAKDTLSLRGAMYDGTSVLKMDPEQIARKLAKLSPPEQEAYRMGAAKALRDKVAGMGDQHDAVGRIFGSPDSRARLQALWPDPEDFARFQQFMADEATMTGTKRFIGNQSSTADKLYEAADLSQVGEFVQHPIRASARALAAALSRAGGMREKSGAEIARLLTDPSAGLGAVERTRTRDALVRQLLGRGGAVSGGLAGGALGQTDGL